MCVVIAQANYKSKHLKMRQLLWSSNVLNWNQSMQGASNRAVGAIFKSNVWSLEMWRGENTGNLQLDFKNLWKHSDLNWNQLLLKIICVQMCYVAVSKYHTCFIMQKLIPQLSKTWNKQIYALQDLPASLDIGICRPFGTACSSPPSPERAFSRKFERHHEIRIRHFMLFWSLRVDWDTFQFQKACETQKNVFVFLKSVSIPDLSPNYQL